MSATVPRPRGAAAGASPSPETVVSLRGLEIRYGNVRAVGGIDLEVRRGEVLGLIGPDGAGKTSVLRVVAGLQRSSGGDVTALSLPVWPNRRPLHRRLGYLAQRFALYGDLTVAENIRFFALLLGVRDWKTRRDLLLDRVGLLPFRERPADQLSGGMKQKLALACSLMHSPEILILDEPTTGVDPVTRREFWRLLADLVAEGLTLVVATPYLDEAERCSRVVLLHEGRVLADAPPNVLRSMLPGIVLDVTGTPRVLLGGLLATLPDILDVQSFAGGFHVRIGAGGIDPNSLRGALDAAGVAVEDVRVVPPTIEDTFLYLTHDAGGTREEAV
jgi:ABC-2 type transport system ATP-binding protein